MHILNTLPQRLDPGATPTFAGLLAGDGTAAAPSISFTSDTDTGFYRNASGQMGFSANGALSLWFATGGRLYGASVEGYTEMPSGGGVNLVAAGSNKNITLTPSTTGTVIVDRGALGGAICFQYGADTASRNWGFKLDTNAYGDFSLMRSSSKTSGLIDTSVFTVTPAGRFLLGTITDSGALLQIGTNTTTSAGGMVFGTDTYFFRYAAGRAVIYGTSTLGEIAYQNSNSLVFGLKIGSTGTGSFINQTENASLVLSTNSTTALTLDSSQTALFAGNVSLAANKSILFGGGTISNIYSTVDGVIVVANNANTGFSRLQFGGTTSSFPALKRNSATLESKLADDSAYTNFAASRYYNGSTNVFWSFGTGSPEGVVSASVGSIYSRTDGGAVTSFYVKESGASNTGWVAK